MVLKKILSKDGATILLALLFFVMCSVAGAIVIGAASASSGRLASLIEQEQTYYTLSSAAQVIRDDAKDRTLTISTTNGSTYTYSISDDGKGIGPWLKEAAKRVNESGNPVNDDTVTMNVTDTTVADFGKIVGTFKMNTDYSVDLMLQRKKSDGTLDDAYVCNVYIGAIKNDTVPSAVTVTWTQGVINK